MSAAGVHQDMPPSGGYGRIVTDRIPLKTPMSGYRLFSLYVGITSFATYLYTLNFRYARKLRRENDDVMVALEPLLMAERDRAFLTQVYRNREDEAELMKNVPGWKVGTLYGEPLFKTIGDKMMDPSPHEYYAHADPADKEYYHMYDFWI